MANSVTPLKVDTYNWVVYGLVVLMNEHPYHTCANEIGECGAYIDTS